jgi:hypothetical protein
MSNQKIYLQQISEFVFKDVSGGKEPLFQLTSSGGYMHQSGYGTLSVERVVIVTKQEVV